MPLCFEESTCCALAWAVVEVALQKLAVNRSRTFGGLLPMPQLPRPVLLPSQSNGGELIGAALR